jgi:TolA-binding protein
MVTKFSKFSKKKKSFMENAVAGIVFVVIFFGVIGFFIFQNITIGEKRVELENQLKELQAQVYEMEGQHQELKEDIADTQTEEYQERLLREQGLYKKEGEEVVTVLPAEGNVVDTHEDEKEEGVWWKPWTW